MNDVEKVKSAQKHIRAAWDTAITVGVNPPGLLRTAVELADQRTPLASLTGAVFAAEALRHMLNLGMETGKDPVLVDLYVRAVTLSEELQQLVARRFDGK